MPCRNRGEIVRGKRAKSRRHRMERAWHRVRGRPPPDGMSRDVRPREMSCWSARSIRSLLTWPWKRSRMAPRERRCSTGAGTQGYRYFLSPADKAEESRTVTLCPRVRCRLCARRRVRSECRCRSPYRPCFPFQSACRSPRPESCGGWCLRTRHRSRSRRNRRVM
jgi:hypothetical protein